MSKVSSGSHILGIKKMMCFRYRVNEMVVSEGLCMHAYVHCRSDGKGEAGLCSDPNSPV